MNTVQAYADRLDRTLDLAVGGSDHALTTVYDLEVADLLKLAVDRLRAATKKADSRVQSVSASTPNPPIKEGRSAMTTVSNTVTTVRETAHQMLALAKELAVGNAIAEGREVLTITFIQHKGLNRDLANGPMPVIRHVTHYGDRFADHGQWADSYTTVGDTWSIDLDGDGFINTFEYLGVFELLATDSDGGVTIASVIN